MLSISDKVSFSIQILARILSGRDFKVVYSIIFVQAIIEKSKRTEKRNYQEKAVLIVKLISDLVPLVTASHNCMTVPSFIVC